MNKTARFVLRVNRRTRTSKLMNMCNWLNVKELCSYHSLSTMWTTLKFGTPTHIRNKLHLDQDRFLTTTTPRIQNTEMAWRWKTVPLWNNLPSDLRHLESHKKFKTELKKWILSNREDTVNTSTQQG